ncbi:hypothetical protein ACFSN5_05715 [Streptococcus tangpeifui]|uniref:hypothetical protein n=1 Tax=Streptococcus tangpeifui TaxID=2709400 RepID=UPI0013EA5541|nr:hypothetical protein [Streptococcus sp. ZJ1593]
MIKTPSRKLVGWAMGLQLIASLVIIPTLIFIIIFVVSASFRENALSFLAHVLGLGNYEDDFTTDFLRVVWFMYSLYAYFLFLLILNLGANIVSIIAASVWSRHFGFLISFLLAWGLEFIFVAVAWSSIYASQENISRIFITGLIGLGLAKIAQVCVITGLFILAGKEIKASQQGQQMIYQQGLNDY